VLAVASVAVIVFLTLAIRFAPRFFLGAEGLRILRIVLDHVRENLRAYSFGGFGKLVGRPAGVDDAQIKNA
jgi:hypothetical protein